MLYLWWFAGTEGSGEGFSGINSTLSPVPAQLSPQDVTIFIFICQSLHCWTKNYRMTRIMSKPPKTTQWLGSFRWYWKRCLILISQILAKCDGQFRSCEFVGVRIPCITGAMHRSHPSHRAETELLWNFGVSTCSIAKLSRKFHPSLSDCSALAENRQYITGLSIYYRIRPVLMACTWKYRVLLAAFWDKISIFHLGQTELRSARGDGLLRTPHRALISFIWCCATQWTRETELNRLNYRDFPLHVLNFARLVPREQVTFSSEPSRNLLCATILDIILTCCAYVLSLRRAFAAATWPCVRRRRSLNILTARKPMGLSSRRRLILLASHLMAMTR